VLRAYGALRAVRVPAGAHLVEFTYRPASLGIGARISAVAGIVLVLLAALPLRRRGRPGRAPGS
jgi:hypothetical protein